MAPERRIEVIGTETFEPETQAISLNRAAGPDQLKNTSFEKSGQQEIVTIGVTLRGCAPQDDSRDLDIDITFSSLIPFTRQR